MASKEVEEILAQIDRERTHILNWIDYNKNDPYARLWFGIFVLNSSFKRKRGLEKFDERNPLFCTFEGKRYRVRGASVCFLGDVWLRNPSITTYQPFYQIRVKVDHCSQWSATLDPSDNDLGDLYLPWRL